MLKYVYRLNFLTFNDGIRLFVIHVLLYVFISYAICSKYVAIAVQRVRKTTSLQFSLHNFSKLDSFIILSSTILIIYFTLGL